MHKKYEEHERLVSAMDAAKMDAKKWAAEKIELIEESREYAKKEAFRQSILWNIVFLVIGLFLGKII
jgi:hypothetical protein